MERKYSPDGEVYFVEETHQYFDRHGNEYCSATKMIGKMFPFNARETAEKVSEMEHSVFFGLPVDEILKRWADTAPIGTALHAGCEHWINTGEIQGDHRAGVEAFAKGALKLGRENLRAEVILYDRELRLAGTADILEFGGEHVENRWPETCRIWDIKTSRKMDQHKLLKYSIQLELYRRWAEGKICSSASVGGLVWFENYVSNRMVHPKTVKPIGCSLEIAELVKMRIEELLWAT
jgi:hypothetical protein